MFFLLDYIMIQQFGVTDYSVPVEGWAPASKPSAVTTFETMAISGLGEQAVVIGTNIDVREINAGHWIFLDLPPATKTDQLFVEIKGRTR